MKNTKTDLVKGLYSQLAERNAALDALTEPVSESMLLSSVIKSTILYMVIGLLLGGMLAVFITFALFFMSNTISNQNIIKKQFNINYLANLPVKAINNSKYSLLDKLTCKLEGDLSYIIPQKENIQKIKIKILLLIEEIENNHIIITGSVKQEYLKKICEILSDEFKDINNISFDYAKNILLSSETMQKVSASTGVMLIEQNQKSSLNVIEQEIETIKEINKPIIGYIML